MAVGMLRDQRREAEDADPDHHADQHGDAVDDRQSGPGPRSGIHVQLRSALQPATAPSPSTAWMRSSSTWPT